MQYRNFIANLRKAWVLSVLGFFGVLFGLFLMLAAGGGAVLGAYAVFGIPLDIVLFLGLFLVICSLAILLVFVVMRIKKRITMWKMVEVECQ